MQVTPQFDLFASAGNSSAAEVETMPAHQPASALDDAIAAINPDALSPREALDALYRLKELSNQHTSG